MKNLIIYLICLLTLNSCFSNIQVREKLNEYNNGLLTFAPDQISHFPHDLTPFIEWGYYVFYPKSTGYNSKAGIIFTALVDSSFYMTTVRSLKLKGFSSFSINSDSLIFVGDTISDYSSITTDYLIPSFLGVKDQYGVSSIRLNKREQIYIIDSKHGKFLEEEDLVTGLDLPPSWMHGYSRGIVVDDLEQRIFYWLVIW